MKSNGFQAQHVTKYYSPDWWVSRPIGRLTAKIIPSLRGLSLIEGESPDRGKVPD